ncbi:DUF4232 domain-containing protein [Rothia nasisuis]|uniref:DUF4232 domain-containing protein n=1 Tax=Rothia nasisuis TaxID=2109647 RepID=UPI001F1A83D5|nr:DUF4232 domain-containing protein [Rothia nasisuis]
MKARTLPLAAALLALLTACGSANTSTETPEATPTTSALAPSNTPTASASATSAPTPSPTSAAPSPTVREVTPSTTPAEPLPTGTVITVEPSESATEQTTAASDSAAPPSSAAGVAVCDYDQLYIEAAVAEGGGAAGSRYITLTFNNTSNDSCTISGYPAVHYVDHAGQQIGAAAANATEWSSSGGTLAPGQSLTATLRETRAQLYGETCQSVSAAGYSIQTPGASQPLVLNFAAEACSNPAVSQLSVGAVGATP